MGPKRCVGASVLFVNYCSCLFMCYKRLQFSLRADVFDYLRLRCICVCICACVVVVFLSLLSRAANVALLGVYFDNRKMVVAALHGQQKLLNRNCFKTSFTALFVLSFQWFQLSEPIVVHRNCSVHRTTPAFCHIYLSWTSFYASPSF